MGSSSGQWSNVYFIGYPDASGNTIPPDVVVPIVIYTYFDYATSQSLQTAFVAIGGVLIGLIIILAAVITKYREHSVIKASSFSFNLVILLGGIGLCCAAIIFTQTTQSNGALCEARAWVTLISIQLLLAPLFMRTHRIARIFVQTELKIVNISNERLLAGIASIVGLQASILLIWTLIPAERSAYTTDDVGSLDDPLNHRYAIVHSCHYSPTFFAINTALVALECLLGAIVGWRVRDVTMGEFNESLHIFVVMAFACAYGVILLPVQFMLSDPSPLLVLRAAGLEFAVCICIGVLFIPKLLLILQRNRAVRRSQQHDANHTVLGKNSSTLTPVLNGTTLHGLNEGSTHREKRTSSTVLPKAKFGSPSVTASTLVGAYSPQLPRHTLLSKNSPPPTTLMMQSLTNTPIPQHRDLLQSIVLQMYPAQQMQHNELAPLAVSGTFTHDTEAAVHGKPTISVESTEIGSAMGSGATASGESTSTVRAPNATPSPSTPNRKRIRVHVNALTNMPLEPIISNSENTTGSNPIMSMDDNASNPI